MFIQVMQGRATNPDGIHAELDRWRAELQPGADPGADGWLGSTSGVTDDGRFIAVVRFASEELWAGQVGASPTPSRSSHEYRHPVPRNPARLSSPAWP